MFNRKKIKSYGTLSSRLSKVSNQPPSLGQTINDRQKWSFTMYVMYMYVYVCMYMYVHV